MIKKTHTFSIDFVSEEDGEHYQGQFTIRRINVSDISKISVRKSQLSGGMFAVRDENGMPTGQGIDVATDFYNYILAVLENQITSAPPWWKLDEIYDQDLVFAVYEEVKKFEKSFRRQRDESSTDSGSGQGRADKGSAEASSAQSSVADHGNLPKKVVDREVQAALDA